MMVIPITLRAVVVSLAIPLVTAFVCPAITTMFMLFLAPDCPEHHQKTKSQQKNDAFHNDLPILFKKRASL